MVVASANCNCKRDNTCECSYTFFWVDTISFGAAKMVRNITCRKYHTPRQFVASNLHWNSKNRLISFAIFWLSQGVIKSKSSSDRWIIQIRHHNLVVFRVGDATDANASWPRTCVSSLAVY